MEISQEQLFITDHSHVAKLAQEELDRQANLTLCLYCKEVKDLRGFLPTPKTSHDYSGPAEGTMVCEPCRDSIAQFNMDVELARQGWRR